MGYSDFVHTTRRQLAKLALKHQVSYPYVYKIEPKALSSFSEYYFKSLYLEKGWHTNTCRYPDSLQSQRLVSKTIYQVKLPNGKIRHVPVEGHVKYCPPSKGDDQTRDPYEPLSILEKDKTLVDKCVDVIQNFFYTEELISEPSYLDLQGSWDYKYTSYVSQGRVSQMRFERRASIFRENDSNTFPIIVI